MSNPINPAIDYNFALRGAAAAGAGIVGNEVVFARDPTTTDLSGPTGAYKIGQLWWSTASNTLFILEATSGGSATWVSTGAVTTPVTVPNGGTGDTTLTNHGVLLGQGTSPIAVTAVGTNGQVLIGATGANPAFATITSSDGSITFTPGANSLDMVASLTTDLASPPPIGNVTPNSGAFTTLTSSGATTLATTGASVNTFGNATGATSVNITNGTGASGWTSTNGALTFNSGTGALGISTDASATTVSIGTGAAIKTVNIATGAAANVVTIGSTTASASLTLQSGSGGNTTISGNVAATITVGATAQTGTITLGSSSASNTQVIAGGSGATTLQIANVQTAGSVSIGSGMTTGTIAIGGTGLQTGTITIGGGTGAQTLNFGTGGTGVKTVHIADTASVANVVSIGSLTGTTTINSPTLVTLASGAGTGLAVDTSGGTGIAATFKSTSTTTDAIQILASSGGIKVNPTVVGAGASPQTCNNRFGQVVFSGVSVASGATQALVVSNTTVTGSSTVVAVWLSGFTQGSAVTLQSVVPAANQFTVNITNGTSATMVTDTANLTVTFWVMN